MIPNLNKNVYKPPLSLIINHQIKCTTILKCAAKDKHREKLKFPRQDPNHWKRNVTEN